VQTLSDVRLSATICGRAYFSWITQTQITLQGGSRALVSAHQKRSSAACAVEGRRALFERTPPQTVVICLQEGSLLFITAIPIRKLFAWGEGDSGGHVYIGTREDPVLLHRMRMLSLVWGSNPKLQTV
jgi:hypothetical protein